MKFNTRHLIGSAILLAGSIAYNVWIFWGPSPGPARRSPGVVGATDAPAGRAAAPPVDPAEIPAPPRVDVTAEPVWARDPFRRVGETPTTIVGAPVSASAVTSDPVVRSILFSPQRRLAMVDGRIVGAGDRLPSGVTVMDIGRDAVTVQMPSGEQRRIALRPSLPGSVR